LPPAPKSPQRRAMMKRTVVLFAAANFALAAPFQALAASDHGSMQMEHGGHMEHKGNIAHQEVVDGVKVTFIMQTMAEAMKAMGMEMPKGVKETHHLHVEFKDAKSGQALTEGEVRVKVQGPDKVEQTRELMAMQGHFGADFGLAKKGRYGIMSKFKLKDGKVRSARFWYEVK
jgi:hypothetical protein